MSENAAKQRGLSRAEAATVLTTLCREALVRSGYSLAAFEITAQEVERALIERRGLGGCLVDMPNPSVDRPVETTDDRNRAVDTDGMSTGAAEVTEEVVGIEYEEGVYRVWQGWLEITGQDKDLPVDPKSQGKISERLAFGFTPDELLLAARKAFDDPALVKRTRIRAISKPLESDQRVCDLLGKVYEKPKRVTWLTPFEELWTKHYPDGVVPNYGAMGKWLAGLVKKHGEKAVLEEADLYLTATNVAYVSWPKFAAGYGTWSYGTKKGSRSDYAREAIKGI